MIRVCPNCGSGKLSVQATKIETAEGGEAKCTNCGWEGPETSLLLVPVIKQPKHIDPNLVIAEAVAASYMEELAKEAAKHIGIAMIRAGIVGGKDTTNLTRLIRAACLGAHKATLEEVERIQKELQDGQSRQSVH